jgi:acyl-CoA synthetase (AMP-forming)/AMP-acid ligase II
VLGKVARAAASRFTDTPLLVTEDGRTLSYAELDRLSDELAAGFVRRGLRPGEVLSVLLPSGPSYVVAYVAAAKLGAVTAGVNERLSAPEQAACLEVAGPALVLVDAGAGGVGSATGALQLADRSLSGSEVAFVDSTLPIAELFGGLRVGGGTPPGLPDDPDRPVAIVFTSGTTGMPKGAVFCASQLEAIGEIDGGRRFGGGGRGLGSTSMAHLATMTKLPQLIRSGGTTFLMRRWSAGEALKAVERNRITTLGGIPTQVALMLRHELFEATDHSSVKAIALGGGPCAPALVRETRERFGVPVVVRYTCTEAGVGTGTLADDPPEDAEETVGRARAGVELSIREAEDGGAVLAPGEVGEVCLKSAAVMAGYYGDPAATAAVMTGDRAVRTGDLGWIDERGRLRLCGRSKEMYVRGGYNVFPLEIESVLCEHPGVAHVAIAPRTDPVMGEIGVAVVVARDLSSPPDLDDLRHYAEGRLAHHKLPEGLLLVDEIPRTAMEKVDRRALQRLVGTGDPPG